MTDFAYTIVVVPDLDDGGYYAFIPDLQGCMGDGETPQDAVSDVMAAAGCWAAVRAEQGRDMPEPGESERALESKLQERDEYVADLEAQIASLKAELRKAERAALIGRSTGLSKAARRFQAA